LSAKFIQKQRQVDKAIEKKLRGEKPKEGWEMGKKDGGTELERGKTNRE
jgi:hypothetical protein